MTDEYPVGRHHQRIIRTLLCATPVNSYRMLVMWAPPGIRAANRIEVVNTPLGTVLGSSPPSQRCAIAEKPRGIWMGETYYWLITLTLTLTVALTLTFILIPITAAITEVRCSSLKLLQNKPNM